MTKPELFETSGASVDPSALASMQSEFCDVLDVSEDCSDGVPLRIGEMTTLGPRVIS
eukprot:CAMPEP_0169177514 /NCGR_PEP_ID=MMETSP1015-20121227/66545_1 /TAXON_ID=342587 /ORGANISM="Karlodinium micrum, Strain CCMP2283" /LENGTH=56 /DNA_ID=CAMNT_0009252295 /DNA_START=119 /DNA_END=289 /DNA_ORIENTATION=+